MDFELDYMDSRDYDNFRSIYRNGSESVIVDNRNSSLVTKIIIIITCIYKAHKTKGYCALYIKHLKYYILS